jgi:hypothetical protein
MGRDTRDEPTWVVVELTRAGNRLLEEAKLESLLRMHLGCGSDHPIFIPTVVFNTDDPDSRIVLSATEGYVFIASGLPDVHYFHLESLPFVRRILTTKDPNTGIRVCNSIPESSLQHIRDQLDALIGDTLAEGMGVRIVHGALAGVHGRIMHTPPGAEFVDVLLTFRSIQMIKRFPRSSIQPLALGG